MVGSDGLGHACGLARDRVRRDYYMSLATRRTGDHLTAAGRQHVRDRG
ncbi:hypothetical protein ACFTSF_06035 [Kribbella sp. NPDC056951]